MTKKQNMSQAFSELEEIVAEFEEGNIDLEESLPKFKKGLELAKFLKKRLKTLENEIVEIRDQFGEMGGEDGGENESLELESSMNSEDELEEELPF